MHRTVRIYQCPAHRGTITVRGRTHPRAVTFGLNIYLNGGNRLDPIDLWLGHGAVRKLYETGGFLIERVDHYRPGTSHWGRTYANRPTAQWVTAPPYADWIATTDLPSDSSETDDPDRDLMNNRAEMLAGTDCWRAPTRRTRHRR